MQEIRFNQPAPVIDKSEEKEATPEVSVKTKKKNILSIIFAILLVVLKILLFVSFLYGVFIGYKYFTKTPNTNTYHAVFLTNDQVYFGRVLENKEKEMILTNVFYLQTVDADFSQQSSKFTLVKLGQELHGPTEMMYINKGQVLFYEELRPDSEVVKAIENFKSR